MENKKLPVGYWIKKADLLLTEGINNIQAEFGLSRTEWQILNSIGESENIPVEKLFELIQPFSDKAQVSQLINKLLETDLIEGTIDYRLTEKGKELHLKCLTKQKNFRVKAMKGIAEEQYEITVSTLAQIVDNLSHSFE